MKNEELILQMLGELKAGQEKLETEVRRTRMLVEQQDHKQGESPRRADRRHACQVAHAGNWCDESHRCTQISSQG